MIACLMVKFSGVAASARFLIYLLVSRVLLVIESQLTDQTLLHNGGTLSILKIASLI